MSTLTIADFDVKETIGTGSYGRVDLVRKKDNDQYYALKMIKKHEIIKSRQIPHIKSERNILCRIHHPFIVNIVSFFKDSRYLYFLMDYACGGELHSHLARFKRFTEDATKFYASQLVLVLEYLHERRIAYRDLKLENILLDKHGYIVLTDFGFAKELNGRTYTFCGTYEYIAPEIIAQKGYGLAVDWWALVLLCGHAPWSNPDHNKLCNAITEGKIVYPKDITLSSDTKVFIKSLLCPEPKRLGNTIESIKSIKNHKWFKNINWNSILFKTVRAPIQIKVDNNWDTKNFPNYPKDFSKVDEVDPNIEDPFDFF